MLFFAFNFIAREARIIDDHIILFGKCGSFQGSMRRHFELVDHISPKQYAYCAQCFSQGIVHISMFGANKKKITSLALISNIDASEFMGFSP